MNENANREMLPEQEDVIDLRKLFYKILAHWGWFIISVPLCLAAALLFCLIKTPVYDIHSKVMISDTKKGELGSSIMVKELGLSPAGDVYVENEMVELQSKNLMREVVQDLELNIRYTREGILRDIELYKDSPVKILIDHPEYIKDTCLYVILQENNEITLTAPDGQVIREGPFFRENPDRRLLYIGREKRGVHGERVNQNQGQPGFAREGNEEFLQETDYNSLGKEHERYPHLVKRPDSLAGNRASTCLG